MPTDYEKDWQASERRAEEDLAAGRSKEFANLSDLAHDLMPTDREIAEVARDASGGIRSSQEYVDDAYAEFMYHFSPERVLTLLDVVEEARDARDGEETNWGALDRLDALDRSNE